MIELIVGKPYPLPTPSQEGASANFLVSSGNTLQINIPDLSKEELFALKKGTIKAGFLYDKGDMLWLFQFFDKKGPVFTLDSPFDVRLIPSDLLALHDITNDQQRLVIDIHVVDSGILRALRGVTMPNELTINFLAAVQDQISTSQKNSSMANWLQQSPDQLCRSTKMFALGK